MQVAIAHARMCAVLLGLSVTTLQAQPLNADSLERVLAIMPEDTGKVNQLIAIGSAFIEQNPSAAIPYFRQACQLARRLGFHPGLEKSYTSFSSAYKLIARFDSALACIDTAIYYAHKTGNASRLALVYYIRADTYFNLEDNPSALEDCDTAIAYAQRSGNRDVEAHTFRLQSGIYMSQNQFSPAQEYLDKANVLYHELGDHRMEAHVMFSSAMLLKRMNKPTEALQAIHKAIAVADSVHDINSLASYYQVLSGILTSAQRFNEAETAAQKALYYAKLSGSKWQEAYALEEFAKIRAAQRNYTGAIGYGEQAFSLYTEIKDLWREQEASRLLADVYRKSGNPDKAYTYLKHSSELRDSLLKKRFSEETARLQTAFDVAQKEHDIAILSKDKELQQQRLSRQRSMFAGAVILIGLLLAGIGLLVSRNRLRQRMKELQLRNTIAADLHDEVGSSLSSIHILSQIAAQGEPRPDVLAKMTRHTRETMEKMSDIVWMIKPGKNESTGLAQRMQRFTYDTAGESGIDIVFDAAALEQARLTMEQKKNIYLIFKEALNNAVKYSDAGKIEVMAKYKDRALQLVIRDNGKGFDANAPSHGNGLDNMRHRAVEAGGRLEITSAPGKGTLIGFSLVVKSEKNF